MAIPTLEEIDEMFEDRLVEAMSIWASMCWSVADDKGFHDPKERDGVVRDLSPVERQMLIVSEAVEMLESYRNDHNASSLYIEVDGKPEGGASELADVMIRCLDYAKIYDIDLGKVMLTKLRYNSTRPHMHKKNM